MTLPSRPLSWLARAGRKTDTFYAATRLHPIYGSIFLFSVSLSLVGAMACSAAAPIAQAVSSLACGALVALLGPSGQFWGTACSGLAQAIVDEITKDTTPAVAAARASSEMSCAKASLVPVPGFEGVAMVCPGLEQVAARGAAKAVAVGKAARR